MRLYTEGAVADVINILKNRFENLLYFVQDMEN